MPPIHVHVEPPAMQQVQPERMIIHGQSPTAPAARPERERAPRQPLPPSEAYPIAPRRRSIDRETVPSTEQKELVQPPKTVREPNKKSSPNNAPNNSPDEQKQLGPRIDSELLEPDKEAPQADLSDFKKIGKVGRQRKYDQLGMNDIEPIRELILFRHQFGKHWPGLSKDMETYYEKMYFSRPRKGEKDYDKHKGCWERRTKWINPSTDTRGVGTNEP